MQENRFNIRKTLDFAKSSIERLKDIDFACKSAKKLWLEAIDYQADYFTRLLRQLERSRIPEEF